MSGKYETPPGRTTHNRGRLVLVHGDVSEKRSVIRYQIIFASIRQPRRRADVGVSGLSAKIGLLGESTRAQRHMGRGNRRAPGQRSTMKPRLESADLTTEDLFIWGDRWGGFRTLECTTLATFSKSGDRRDADLMLIAQRYPDMCCYSVAVGTGTMIRCCQRVRGEYAGWCGDRAVFDITKCV